MRRAGTVAAILVLLAAGATIAASCDSDRSCSGNAECEGAGSECRPSVFQCPGQSRVVTLGPGQCRDKGAACASDADCVPEETCDLSQQPGVCRIPPPDYCTVVPPACPAGCPWTSGFPCACVCKTCPATDGGT